MGHLLVNRPRQIHPSAHRASALSALERRQSNVPTMVSVVDHLSTLRFGPTFVQSMNNRRLVISSNDSCSGQMSHFPRTRARKSPAPPSEFLRSLSPAHIVPAQPVCIPCPFLDIPKPSLFVPQALTSVLALIRGAHHLSICPICPQMGRFVVHPSGEYGDDWVHLWTNVAIWWPVARPCTTLPVGQAYTV